MPLRLDNRGTRGHLAAMVRQPDERFEILVVGGGMAGLTLALATARAGLSTALVERQRPQAVVTPAFDGRVTSLNYGSHALLRVLGVWPALAPHAETIRAIRVADGRSPFFLHFDHQEVGERPFGYMVENRFIRAGLLEAARTAANLRFLAPESVAGVTADAHGIEARLESGRRLRARLAVAADGRASPLREAAGIRLLSWVYPQTAIVCTVAHERPHHGVAKEHFLAAGPFALLPMQNNHASLVWTEDQDVARAMLVLEDADFAAEIQARCDEHLGRVRPVGPRWSYPLGLQNAERYVAPRLALIGDAAHAMHPLAGQGINLGLRDVAWLAELVVDAARLGLDVGGEALLARYQRQRRWDSFTMLVMTDGLNRLFSNRSNLLRLARGLGLSAVNGIGPAKRFFERRASAMSGDLPRLIRGEAL